MKAEMFFLNKIINTKKRLIKLNTMIPIHISGCPFIFMRPYCAFFLPKINFPV